MRLQWALAMRELRLSPRRTLLVVLALVLGIWGAGVPLISFFILDHDLAANFERTRPPHLILRSKDFARLDLRAFVDRPDIEAAALRDFSLHRVEVRPDSWLPLYLYGVDSFEATPLATLLPQAGALVPPPGTVLVERDGLRVSSFQVGDAPRIRVGDHLASMPISGATFDAGQAPATQDAFIYAYADRATWAALSGQTSGQRLLVRLTAVHSADDVRRVAAKLAEDLNAEGVVLESTEVPRFEQHPHQWQLNTLLFLVSAIGVLAFMMAAVLVSQLMRAVLAGQVRQIGLLKAVGATRWQVFRVALMTIAAMGAMAGLVGVPLAAVSGRRFSAFVAATLNFDLLTPGVPLVALAGLVIASVVMPVLFAMPTLLRGTRLSVKEALREVAVSRPNARTVSPRSWPSAMFWLALRNVLRDRRRLYVTVLSTALGVAIFETGFNVRASLEQMLSEVSHEQGYDVQVVLDRPTLSGEALAPFTALSNVDRVETWSGGQGEIQSRVLSTREGVGVVALPRATDLLHLRLTSGRWLAPSAELEVVLNQQAWLAYGEPNIGGTVEISVGSQTTTAVVVGLAQQFEKPKLYVDLEDFNARLDPRRGITTMLFVAEHDAYEDVLELKREIERAVAASDLPVLYVMSHAERVRIIYEHLDIILVALLLLSFLVLVVSAVGSASAVGVDVLQRTRELGVMRAIGAPPQAIVRLLRLEGMLVSVLGVATGLGFAVPLTIHATQLFGALMLGNGARLEPAFSGVGVLATVVATCGFALLASWAPAQRALRIPTVEALASRP